MTFKLKGNFPALITPMTKDLEIDFESLRKFVDFQIENGVDGLLVCGTTGESATMSHAEHKKVVETVVDQANGKCQVLAGTGSNSTREAIDLTEHAENVGADASMLICPYYNKPTQRGLINHFKIVAGKTELPVVLYNVPSRTGRNIEAETTIELSKVSNIIGIKEASGNVGQIMKIIKETDSKNFSVISGDDSLTFTICALGGTGIISVATNVVPQLMSEYVHKLLDGKYEEARKDHYKLYDLFKILFIETNPGPVKEAARIFKVGGIENWYLRPPLIKTTAESSEKIKKVIDELNVY
ncbi:MAG: 4-hydroxy-tetrahydrodipicolinate synthase [Candidatus Lokiarchaeota archaeon]|nr:4-hydroxy-tetrahydrodipicolinate synthase [Candidatus Lokiarchaeota archaeon]